ncbi:MAG: hypothetical protein NTY74_14110 [Ignavibacteriae bacterium]|nr:hypothetical protein [Ignavibacteriota bacterium]
MSLTKQYLKKPDISDFKGEYESYAFFLKNKWGGFLRVLVFISLFLFLLTLLILKLVDHSASFIQEAIYLYFILPFPLLILLSYIPYYIINSKSNYKKATQEYNNKVKDLKAQGFVYGKATVTCPACNGAKKSFSTNCPECKGAPASTQTTTCSECNGSTFCPICGRTGRCVRCGGSGYRNGHECNDCFGIGTCRLCGGKGVCYKCKGVGKGVFQCPTCKGVGQIKTESCYRCNDSGTIISDEECWYK